MLVSEIIERWLVFILFSIAFMGLKIWDHEKDRYRGFSRPDVYGYVLVIMLFGGVFAWLKGETWAEILVTLSIGGLIVLLVPRVYAEIMHKRRFGVWISHTARQNESADRKSE